MGRNGSEFLPQILNQVQILESILFGEFYLNTTPVQTELYSDRNTDKVTCVYTKKKKRKILVKFIILQFQGNLKNSTSTTTHQNSSYKQQ